MSGVLEHLIEQWLAGVTPSPPWTREALDNLDVRVARLERADRENQNATPNESRPAPAGIPEPRSSSSRAPSS